MTTTDRAFGPKHLAKILGGGRMQRRRPTPSLDGIEARSGVQAGHDRTDTRLAVGVELTPEAQAQLRSLRRRGLAPKATAWSTSYPGASDAIGRHAERITVTAIRADKSGGGKPKRRLTRRQREAQLRKL